MISRLSLYPALLSLLFITLLISSCTDMYDQPSFKAQEGPRLSAPEGAVPVRGIEIFSPDERLDNPVSKTHVSIQSGKRLFAINCAMCHGPEGRGDGLVGKKFIPPPPNLHTEKVQSLGESDIHQRITNGYGRMPAFRKRISTENRWNLVNYLKELNEK